jgi:hypothetical protein
MTVALNLANFADGTTQFDLRPLTLFSGNPQNPCGPNNQYAPFGATLAGCTQLTASNAAPAGLNLEAYPYTLPEDYPSRTNRILIGKNLDEVGLYDQNLRDAIETGLELSGQGLRAQSSAGEIARLILGFVPVIGDSVDLLEQLYNRASGRGVDPVIAFLAGAGLALDVATGGAGDITAGLKGVYRFSKSSAGFFALQIRTTVTGLITGRARPSVALSTLRAQFQTVSTLFFREGWRGVVSADRLGRGLRNTPVCPVLTGQGISAQNQCDPTIIQAVVQNIAKSAFDARVSAADLQQALIRVCCSPADGGGGYITGAEKLVIEASRRQTADGIRGVISEARGGDLLRNAGWINLSFPTAKVRLTDGREVEVDFFGTGKDGVDRVVEIKAGGRGVSRSQEQNLIDAANALGKRPATLVTVEAKLRDPQFLRNLRSKGIDVIDGAGNVRN